MQVAIAGQTIEGSRRPHAHLVFNSFFRIKLADSICFNLRLPGQNQQPQTSFMSFYMDKTKKETYRF